LSKVQNYRARYNIEHLFRFSKGNLLIDKHQTAKVYHEELWWSLCLLAYTQLYLAKNISSCLPSPWERYSPVYKNIEGQKDKVSTPSQTQRGFYDILKALGTPAQECAKRGKAKGRTTGEIQTKRSIHPVVFKEKKERKKPAKTILLGSGIIRLLSDPKRIDEMIKFLQTSLKDLDIRPSAFSNMLINST